MTETALDIITKALKRLGVISGTETPSADLAADGLDRLNGLIETWSTESLTLYTQITIGGPLNPLPLPALPWYMVGPNGDIDVPMRPAWIDSISWVYNTNPITQRKLTPFTKQEWESENISLVTSTEATRYFYRTDWPLGWLYLYPKVTVGPITLWLFVPVPLVGPAEFTTVLSYPPGYSRALRDWLAIELAPEVSRPVDPALIAAATDAKAQLQRVNFRPRELYLPPELGRISDDYGSGRSGAYDWRTDE